ncbi:hypothetical protein T492DRAFT_163894 [Pavlovales sp. CCMP2436]|nr:hypothetical protein T492DRAFT_163894 [Pavlovales sp. CCMP2436]
MSKSMRDLETVLLPCGKVPYAQYTAPVLVHTAPTAPPATAAVNNANPSAMPSPPPLPATSLLSPAAADVVRKPRRARALARRAARRQESARSASSAAAGERPRADRHAARVKGVRVALPTVLQRQVRLEVGRQRGIEPTLPESRCTRAALLWLGQLVPDAVPDRRGRDRANNVSRLAGDAPQAGRRRRPRSLRGGARPDSGHARTLHGGFSGLCDHILCSHLGVPHDAARPKDVRGQQGRCHCVQADGLRRAGKGAVLTLRAHARVATRRLT